MGSQCQHIMGIIQRRPRTNSKVKQVKQDGGNECSLGHPEFKIRHSAGNLKHSIVSSREKTGLKKKP